MIMKVYAKIFLIIIISVCLVSCKKKSKTEVLPSESNQLSIDNTFGDNGRLIFSDKNFYKIHLIQNNIVLSDNIFQSFLGVFSLSSFNYDGISDFSYGLGGRLDIPINEDVYDACILNDRSCWMTRAGIGAIHYNHLGLPVDTIANRLYKIVKYDEDRILCYGYDTICRFNIVGLPDLSFGTNGFIQTDLFAGTTEYLGDFYTYGGGIPFLVKKIKANGQLDNTFAMNGILDASLPKEDNYHLKIYNNKIYVFCSVMNDDHTFSIVIKCYSLNGNMDNSFGNSGILILTYSKPGISLFASSTVFQNDNIYILSNCYSNSTNTKSVLSKVKTNGLEYKSFGENGFMLLGDNIGIGTDIKIKNDKLFILAKYEDTTSTSIIGSSILLKYIIK